VYKVIFPSKLKKEWKKIPKNLHLGIKNKVNDLSESPFPPGYKKIVCKIEENLYRIRVGRYRITYEVNKKEKKVIIKNIRIRDESTYKNPIKEKNHRGFSQLRDRSHDSSNRNTLSIPIRSKSQLAKIHEAEKILLGAGVTFDTGTTFEQGKPQNRDWELDWSLKGGEIKRNPGGLMSLYHSGPNPEGYEIRNEETFIIVGPSGMMRLYVEGEYFELDDKNERFIMNSTIKVGSGYSSVEEVVAAAQKFYNEEGWMRKNPAEGGILIGCFYGLGIVAGKALVSSFRNNPRSNPFNALIYGAGVGAGIIMGEVIASSIRDGVKKNPKIESEFDVQYEIWPDYKKAILVGRGDIKDGGLDLILDELEDRGVEKVVGFGRREWGGWDVEEECEGWFRMSRLV